MKWIVIPIGVHVGEWVYGPFNTQQEAQTFKQESFRFSKLKVVVRPLVEGVIPVPKVPTIK